MKSKINAKVSTNKFKNSNTLPVIPPAAVVISADELERLKQSASIKTDEEIFAEKASTIKMKEERERKAKERKERMKELGLT